LVRHSPAVDLWVPRATPPLLDLINSLVDDYHPYAIEDRNLELQEGADSGGWSGRVYFFSDTDRQAALLALREHLADSDVVVTTIDVVDDGTSWAIRSQAMLQAIQIGAIVVTPPWDIPQMRADTIRVLIYPSTGFGTGHHATTQLCLSLLQKYPIRNHEVIDIGTGSGVLAIAAAKLGASSVVAVENDPDAASVARKNIADNGATEIVTLYEGDIRTLSIRPVPFVTANLTSAMLVNETQAISRCAQPGGTLILSGIASGDEVEVVKQFQSVAELKDKLYEADWAALVMKKRECGY